VPGRVLVAVKHQPAGGADLRAQAQALLHPCATATSVRAGRGEFHHHHSPASPRSVNAPSSRGPGGTGGPPACTRMPADRGLPPVSPL